MSKAKFNFNIIIVKNRKKVFFFLNMAMLKTVARSFNILKRFPRYRRVCFSSFEFIYSQNVQTSNHLFALFCEL